MLASALLATQVQSATYPGQDCHGRNGASLVYLGTGAINNDTSDIYITCPVVRLNDGGTAPVGAVIYFVDDGKTKFCYFDNFNIGTGAYWKWTSASGVGRLAFPQLSPTKQWSPYAFNCRLPGGSQVTGYYVGEH
jgi:hypothetical protein